MSIVIADHIALWHGLAGGLLIGLAAALMLLGAGRIAGVSGLLAKSLGLAQSDISLSSAWAFIIGLPLGAALMQMFIGREASSFTTGPLLIIAGFLVGFGTRMGSGCTSGHGVCGVSRFSQRSIVATLAFILAGMATVFITSHIGG